MKLETQSVKFDSHLLRKYDRPLPRYTSYPPATQLTSDFEEIDFRSSIAVGNYKKTPLSLYCHIPFCDAACYFCGCNTIITQRREVAQPYLEYLIRHLHSLADLVHSDRLVNQMHWGGGTPNYLSQHQIETLWNAIASRYHFAEDAEISIEVNPRTLDRNYSGFHISEVQAGWPQSFQQRILTVLHLSENCYMFSF